MNPLTGKLVMSNLCFVEDEFTQNRYEGHSRWIVTLNSGLSVYQDDDRPGVEPRSAWERLGIYCKESGDFPVGMRVQFRSHVEHLPDNAAGYYFVNSVLGSLHNPETYHFFIVGTLTGTREDGVITVREYKVPELIDISTETRNPKDAGICLICKEK